MPPFRDGSQEEEARLTPVAPRFDRVFGFVVTATMGALMAFALLWVGLDSFIDDIVNYLLREVIADGRVRLAGVSAPLSEEPARLVGFTAAIATIGWVARREGVPSSALELRSTRIPLAWCFGMLAGGVFAVLETLGNGDPWVAVLPRTVGHGSYGTLLIMGLMWYRRGGHVSSVVGMLLLAIVVHGMGNSLGALELGWIVVGFRIVSASAIVVLASVATQLKPSVFGAWSFDLGHDSPLS